MTAEIGRFLADARSNTGLPAELAGTNLDAAVKLANARGYKISRADIDSYIAARKSELNDEQLDHIAGGGKKKNKPKGQFGTRTTFWPSGYTPWTETKSEIEHGAHGRLSFHVQSDSISTSTDRRIHSRYGRSRRSVKRIIIGLAARKVMIGWSGRRRS
jgi:hypothetical protein